MPEGYLEETKVSGPKDDVCSICLMGMIYFYYLLFTFIICPDLDKAPSIPGII